MPHYWKIVLAVLGLVITSWGIAAGSRIGAVGGLLFIGGALAVISDLRDVRRRIHALYPLPSNGKLGEVELTGGYNSFERIDTPHGSAITDQTVNRWLNSVGDLPVEVDPSEYRPPKGVDWATALVVAAARRRGSQDFNDIKVRLRTDMVPGDLPAAVEVQRTRFFYAKVTNDLVATEYASRDPRWAGLAAQGVGFPTSRLPSLRVSQFSNHVGVDTLTLTRCGELIVGVQTHKNSQSPGLLAPSGSGSADWRDLEWALREGRGFLGFVRRAMERELTEECGVPFERVQGTTILGFARFLHRGGKPQFFGFTHLDASVDDLRRTRHERRFVEAHRVEPLDLTTASSIAASLRRFVAREGDRVSVPLHVGVELLLRWLEEDQAAVRHLQACAPDAVLG